MTDTIVYKLVSVGGGIDGRDHTDTGGEVVAAFLTRDEAERAPCRPWAKVVPEVVDLAAVRVAAMARLTPIEKIALGLNR